MMKLLIGIAAGYIFSEWISQNIPMASQLKSTVISNTGILESKGTVSRLPATIQQPTNQFIFQIPS